jgi:SulP family sulfate permease
MAEGQERDGHPRRSAGLVPAPADLRCDLIAALALAAVAVPEQMATARLAGVPASVGLAVFVAASLGFYFAGSNRYLSVGADSTIAPIFAASPALLAVAGTQQYLPLAALLALMIGVLVAAGGLLKMGWIARLLSRPVITGFLAGIALRIVLTQLPALLGFTAAHRDLAGLAAEVMIHAAHPNLFTLATGFSVLAIILICERIDRRLPGALIAVSLASLLVFIIGAGKIDVTLVGRVQLSTLAPRLPADILSHAGALSPAALLIALVIIIQTAATVEAFPDGTAPGKLNRDLFGVGVSNILCGLAGGFPADSSPPRTAVAKAGGAATRFAGLCAALAVAGILLLGPGLLARVPEAALAGLLLFVARRLFRLDTMKSVAAQSRAEFLLLLATAIAIVIMPIQAGVGVGIALSLLHGVWTIAQTRAVEFHRVPGTTIWWPVSPEFRGETVPGILVVGFQAPLFFLNAETFRSSLEAVARDAKLRAIILEAGSIAELDYSGAETLAALIRSWREKGVDFAVARLESLRAQNAFARFGLVGLLSGRRWFHSVEDAVRYLTQKGSDRLSEPGAGG